MSWYWIGKMTKRLGLSRSSGSIVGSKGYDGLWWARAATSTFASISDFCSDFETSSIPWSFGCLTGRTFVSFSVSAFLGLCEASRSGEINFCCFLRFTQTKKNSARGKIEGVRCEVNIFGGKTFISILSWGAAWCFNRRMNLNFFPSSHKLIFSITFSLCVTLQILFNLPSMKTFPFSPKHFPSPSSWLLPIETFSLLIFSDFAYVVLRIPFQSWWMKVIKFHLIVNLYVSSGQCPSFEWA